MKNYFNTILVGNSGFLGRAFLAHNEKILSVGRTNLSDVYNNNHLHIDSWKDLKPLDEIEFENVIFLIGSSDHELINNDPTLAIEKNFLPLINFLDYMKERSLRPKKIVAFTTMLQYDSNQLKLPCKENTKRNPYINKYVFSKFLAEEATSFYRKYFDIIDIRLSNVYGPTELKRPDIIPSLVWSLLENDSTYVRTKVPIRDFVFVNDVIEIVEHLLNTTFSGPINVGSGNGTSVDEICAILENLSGQKIKELGEPFTGHKIYYHDLSLLKTYVNFQPTSISTGLQITYKKMLDFKINGSRI